MNVLVLSDDQEQRTALKRLLLLSDARVRLVYEASTEADAARMLRHVRIDMVLVTRNASAPGEEEDMVMARRLRSEGRQACTILVADQATWARALPRWTRSTHATRSSRALAGG